MCTFSSVQRIPVCSCSSFPQVELGNSLSARVNKKSVISSTKDSNQGEKMLHEMKYTEKFICVEGPQYLRAARS